MSDVHPEDTGIAGTASTASTSPAIGVGEQVSSHAGRPRSRSVSPTADASRSQRRFQSTEQAERRRRSSDEDTYSDVYIPLLTEAAIAVGILRGNRATRLRQWSHSEELLRRFPEAAHLVTKLAPSIEKLRGMLGNPRSQTVNLIGRPQAQMLLTKFDNWARDSEGLSDYHLEAEVQNFFMNELAADLFRVQSSGNTLVGNMHSFMAQRRE
jgi:hypothetical protein